MGAGKRREAAAGNEAAGCSQGGGSGCAHQAALVHEE